MKQNILFLCTGNSCRSQMAEGWAKKLKSDHLNFFSAGTKKHGLNPYAIKVMSEVEIDISHHESNIIEDFNDTEMDIVFTVCSDAHETCPIFTGSKIIHVGFDDPPRLTQDMSNEQEILPVYRRVRDEIKVFISGIEKWMEEK